MRPRPPAPAAKPSIWGAATTATTAAVVGLGIREHFRLGDHVIVPARAATASAEWLLKRPIDLERTAVLSFVDPTVPVQERLARAAGGRLRQFGGGSLNLDALMASLAGGVAVVVGHSERGRIVQRRMVDGQLGEVVGRVEIARVREAARRNRVHLLLATCRGAEDGGSGFTTDIWVQRHGVPLVEAVLKGGILADVYSRLGAPDAPYVLADPDGGPEIVHRLVLTARRTVEAALVTRIVFESGYPQSEQASAVTPPESGTDYLTIAMWLLVAAIVIGGVVTRVQGVPPRTEFVDRWSVPLEALAGLSPALRSEIARRIARREFDFLDAAQRQAVLETLAKDPPKASAQAQTWPFGPQGNLAIIERYGGAPIPASVGRTPPAA